MEIPTEVAPLGDSAMAKYRAMYELSIKDPSGFWAEQARAYQEFAAVLTDFDGFDMVQLLEAALADAGGLGVDLRSERLDAVSALDLDRDRAAARRTNEDLHCFGGEEVRGRGAGMPGGAGGNLAHIVFFFVFFFFRKS